MRCARVFMPRFVVEFERKKRAVPQGPRTYSERIDLSVTCHDFFPFP